MLVLEHMDALVLKRISIYVMVCICILVLEHRDDFAQEHKDVLVHERSLTLATRVLLSWCICI